MEVTVTDLSPCRKQLRIEVDAETVDAKFDAVAKDFRRQAHLPGFRPGKAPLPNVMRAYGDKIADEAKRALMADSYSDALKQQELKPVIMPEIEELQFGHGKPFQYMATLEVSPAFELPEYNGLEVEKERRSVTEEDVTMALSTLQEQRVEYRDVDRPMGEEDFVVVNYKGTVDGNPITDIVKVARGITEQANAWLHLKRNPLVPGLVEALIGGSKGDKKTVEVTFPEEFIYEELVGKEAKYEIEIVDIKEQSLPELDDTFAKSFGAEGIEKLREGVETDLKNELEYSQKQSVRNQCVQRLLDAVTCDLPETIVNQATRAAVHNIVQSNHNRGVSKEVIEENKDDIYTNAKANAELRVKANYPRADRRERGHQGDRAGTQPPSCCDGYAAKNQAAKNGRSTQGKRRHLRGAGRNPQRQSHRLARGKSQRHRDRSQAGGRAHSLARARRRLRPRPLALTGQALVSFY